ncbi:MAG: hypothetical protein ACAH59_08480, partial [Pseudobdellovibrionaceae bacterium]
LEYGEKVGVQMHASKEIDGASKEYAQKNTKSAFSTQRDVESNRKTYAKEAASSMTEVLSGFELSEKAQLKKAAIQFFSQNAALPLGSHFILSEGGEDSMKQLLEFILKTHDPAKQSLIHLAIGSEPSRGAEDKGVRSASFFAKYLAQNPELIQELKHRNIHFMVYDVKSGRHYGSPETYFKSNDWKSELRKFATARKEIETGEIKEKSASERTSIQARDQFEKTISEALAGITKQEGKVNLLVEKMQRSLGSASEVSARQKSGAGVDPAAAAKAATRATK